MLRLGRLKKRPEFLRVAGKGRKVATPGLVLQALPRQGQTDETDGPAPSRQTGARASEASGLARVGFTASRKVGNAVERNRARRRLRAAVNEVLPAAGLPSRDYVVIARQGTLHRPWPDLLQDLRSALAQIETAGRTGSSKRRRSGKRPTDGDSRRRQATREAG